MNRPIRTVAIFCMFLFLALMINVSYLQFWHADELNEDPLNARVAEAAFSRERGDILAGDGRDQVTLARSRDYDDQYKYLRVYPQPLKYANVTGYLTLGSQTGIERSQNAILSGEDERLFVTRLIDLAQNQSNKGGNVLLTIDPEVQEAAYDTLLATIGPEGEGSVVAMEPKTGRILAMVSLPSYDPNDLARIRPVLGSIATTDPSPSGPTVDRRESYAASCTSGSMVSRTLPPLLLWFWARSMSRVTKRRSSSPDRMAFCERSIPVWLPRVR